MSFHRDLANVEQPMDERAFVHNNREQSVRVPMRVLSKARACCYANETPHKLNSKYDVGDVLYHTRKIPAPVVKVIQISQQRSGSFLYTVKEQKPDGTFDGHEVTNVRENELSPI